jgi:hypothetical protein
MFAAVHVGSSRTSDQASRRGNLEAAVADRLAKRWESTYSYRQKIADRRGQ